MKLAVACKVCHELGSTTIGEAIMFIKMHAASMFPYEDINRELQELDAEAVGVDLSMSLEDLLTSGFRMLDAEKGSHIPFLYRGICEDTGEEIIGYAIKCDGRVNPGQVFICPVVNSASFAGVGEKGEPLHSFGPFYLITPGTLELALGPNMPSAQTESEEANTMFEFLYRDASNYKALNRFVLAGTLSAEEIQEIRACGDGDNFIAEQVGLSHETPDGAITQDDHAWCEFLDDENCGFTATAQASTVDLTAKQLLEKFRAAKGRWDEAKYAPEYC